MGPPYSFFLLLTALRELRRVVEDGVDFLEAAVGFDGRLALWIGTDELLEDGASHGRMLLLKMGIPNFEERGRDFITGRIKGKYPFKFINSFLETPLPIIAFAQPVLAIRGKRRIRECTKKF